MSRILLDTHALLFFLFDDPRLSATACEMIEDEEHVKLLSIASLWEITIKTQIGRLELGMNLDRFLFEFIRDRPWQLIPIELPHLLKYAALPLLHRDPFDRLLIAQAQALEIPLLTNDRSFAAYEVDTLWE